MLNKIMITISPLITASLLVLFTTSCGSSIENKEQAFEEIHKLVEKEIKPSYNENRVRANIKLTKTNLLSMLPDINEESPLLLNIRDSTSVEVAEIYTTWEKAGPDRDGMYIEMANRFNRLGKKTKNGKTAAINIRKIDGGLGAQFMLANRHMPDGYSPSHYLWADMLQANGIKTETISEQTAPNIAGIVVKKSKLDQITENGKLDLGKLITNVSAGSFAMGYTNPYQSSTGLNFLLTILNSFAQGDESQMLSDDVASAFEAFQTGVPFVAQNTLQMRDATVGSGVLDAFVIEYQSWANVTGMNDYQFIPFGVRHDNPLYATPGADKTEREVLKMFNRFMISQKTMLVDYGFNPPFDYKNAYSLKDSSIIGQAQKLWKKKKSGGRPIAAFFVADTSGSMEGTRIKNLKKALIESSDLINTTNAIGLITYNDKVNVDLFIKPFNLQQKALFIGAVERLYAGGKTATNDAVLVAVDRLVEFGKTHPDYKKVIFVLSDGATNRGQDFEDIKPALEWAGVPIHSIAYELSSEHLKQMAALAEGAYIKSSANSASYRIGNLLNSEM